MVQTLNNPAFIRTLYQPSQPLENESGRGKLFYKEYLPCHLLQNYIHCFWELRTTERINEPYSYRVVADGCIDLLTDNKDYNGLIVAGIADQAFDIPMNGEHSYFGIRFLPGCFHHFFKLPASHVAGQMINAKLLLEKDTGIFSQLLFDGKTIREKINTAESFLLTRLTKIKASHHPRLAAALHYILSGHGTVPIETKAAEWISPRQLRRLFHEYVGCSPKLFSRIVRFQQTLSDLQESNDRSVYFDHGYFDQAHFIKEFKTFYGDTPAKFTTNNLTR